MNKCCVDGKIIYPHELKYWFKTYCLRFSLMQMKFDSLNIPYDIFRVVMWLFFQLSPPNLSIVSIVCGPENTLITTKFGLLGCGSNKNSKISICRPSLPNEYYERFKKLNYFDNICSVACFEEGILIHTKNKIISYGNTPFLESDLNFFRLTPHEIQSFHSAQTKNNTLFMLTKSGLLFGVGFNQSGLLGLNHKNYQYHLTQIDIPSQKILSIDCKTDHSMVISQEGILFGCGSNIWGQLGLGITLLLIFFLQIVIYKPFTLLQVTI
jgi:alpha-tubulin suppressor-like RCC1 family protein